MDRLRVHVYHCHFHVLSSADVMAAMTALCHNASVEVSKPDNENEPDSYDVYLS